MKRSIVIIFALLSQLNLSALFFGPIPFFQVMCSETPNEGSLILEATFIQKSTVFGVGGEIGEFSIDDIWCGTRMNIEDTDQELPEWTNDFVDTESSFWVEMQHGSTPIYLNAQPGDRFLLSLSFNSFSGHYTMHVIASQPLLIDGNDEVTGLLSSSTEETLTLQAVRNQFDACSNCSDTANGIADRPYTEITVVPNPALESIGFSAFEFRSGQELRIYSTAGQLVKRKTIFSETTFDVADLNPGLYFLEIVGESGERFSSSFVKRQ